MARGRYVNAKELATFEAADEFCFTLAMLMSIGAFETIDVTTEVGKDTREAIMRAFTPWVNLTESITGELP